ncbi:GGDEF domain-containing protein [Vibrio sp. RE86]|uniref:GGDEF domain-containing protein n=1 Tax=Vibrio sp. RE86 TaxID=2607605 RepID=UPI0014937EAB|nr:GGDEF domain-containing protein [Vibrio sp. RE86]NOH79437.1 GGDEF domain-containing protein [Vibrio sp. RE86]
MTLRLKLLLLVLSSSAIFVFAAYSISKHVTDKVVTELLWKYAQVSAHHDAETILMPIIKEVERVKLLASHPNITSWGFNSNDEVYRSVAEDTLDRFRWGFTSKNFFIALDQNLSYHFNDVQSIRQTSFLRHHLEPESAYDKWYFEQRDSRLDLTVNIARDAHLDMTRVWINQSIIKNGEFLGIVGTGIEVSLLFNQLSNHHSSALRTMFVDDSRRVQITFEAGDFHYPLRDSAKMKPLLHEVVSNSKDYLALEDLMQRQKNGEEAEVLMIQQGEGNAVVAIHYVEELGWYELTFVSIDAMVPNWVSTYLYFPLAVITLLFALISYLYLVKRWVVPNEYWTQRLAYLSETQTERVNFSVKGVNHCIDLIESELNESRIGVDNMVASRTEALDKMSVFDLVTKLHNKRGLERELKLELARAAREQYRFGLLWIDAGFSPTIDTEKHTELYRLSLKLVAEGLNHAIREYDIAARWADDEFLLLIRSDQQATLEQIATRIKHHIDNHKHNSLVDIALPINVTIGGALIEPDVSFQQALALADSALYVAKSTHESAIHIHADIDEKKSA